MFFLFNTPLLFLQVYIFFSVIKKKSTSILFPLTDIGHTQENTENNSYQETGGSYLKGPLRGLNNETDANQS